MIAVRIVCMDHYMSAPIKGLDPQNSVFRGSSVVKLPIIRIFGSTDDGRKVCLHIHGAFPYIYVPVDGNEDAKGAAYQLASGLDKALNISQGQASSGHEHVYEVAVVSAIPIYGYHAHELPFFKISFYNPQTAKRACALLQNGSVLGRAHQPHEAHIPFHQQFMIDRNLHGMNLIKLRRVLYRTDSSAVEHILTGVKKMSVCSVEMDARVEDIMNTSEIGEVNPGIEYICEEERTRRRDAGEDTQLSKFLTSERSMTSEAAASSEKYRIILSSKLEDTLESQDSLFDLSCLDSTVINEDAEFLMSMLKDNEGVEDDSVLSQRGRCEDDEEPDLRVPLASVTTPVKVMLGEVEDDIWNDSFFLTPEGEAVAQVDGCLPFEVKTTNSNLEDITTKSAKNSILEDVNVGTTNSTSNTKLLTSNVTIEQLDGRNGSSSSEDEGRKVVVRKRRRVGKVKTSPGQYPPLEVIVRSPARRREHGSSEHRLPSHTAGVVDLKTNEYPAKQTSFLVVGNTDASPTRVIGVTSGTPGGNTAKRKLSFQRLDATVVEENIPCWYSPARRNARLTGVKKTVNREESDVDSIVTAAVNTDGGYAHSDNSTDIFSTETSNDSHVQQPTAARYDATVKYVPVPGPSRDVKIVISGETSSSSGLPTPYQGKTSTVAFGGNLTSISEDDDDDVNTAEFSGCNITSISQKDSSLPDSIVDSQSNTPTISRTLISDLTVTELIEDNLISAEKTSEGHCVLIPKYNPPSVGLVRSTMARYGVPEVRNQDPYYSDPSDLTGSIEVGHSVLKIKSKTTADLDDFDGDFKGFAKMRLNKSIGMLGEVVKLSPAQLPPSRREVELWVTARSIRKGGEVQVQVRKREKVKCVVGDGGNGSEDDSSLTLSPCTPIEADQVRSTNEEPEDSSVVDSNGASLQRVLEQSRLFRETGSQLNASHQITGASLDNTHGFKFSLENYQNVRSRVVQQHLTTLVVELHVDTRGALLPDPELDAIAAIFYAKLDPDGQDELGMVAVNASGLFPGTVVHASNELELYSLFLDLVRKWDPDVFIGYEIETASWGYLVERGYKLGLNYGVELSRVPWETTRTREDASEMSIAGRIVLDLWRLLRHELSLTGYSFENVVYHVLHERVAVFSAQDLTNWWVHKSEKVRLRTVDFYVYRVRAVLRLLDHFDLLGRTSELARLFGILFYEVLSRGSQFRVESMMLRLAKPANYIAVSPSVQQRAKMRAPEFLPLILEPESKFYKDPVIVLDFQSLYPSMIIAYNYCFSTCVGRCENLTSNSAYEFGACNLRTSRARIRKLLADDLLHFSPPGIGFVKASVRDGVLPRMLREILDTRLLVKNAMKRTKSNKTLQRVLHSRQLGLKLIANVTYGYTAANFSGRMPAVEIADSVVAKGRETLQRAIKLVETNSEWNARVVYGDTDSLFVLVPGRTRAEAFRIGAEIAEIVTNSNPSPVRLKLEKVYQPCVLQTKKRYVGYLYESPEQESPEFDAKGIETVRRDGCPAVGKMLEKCLRMLFETRDVSAIKRYVQRQFHKLLSGRVSMQDLTFAKEYRGEAGYRPGACVPALELTKKWKSVDRRKEPRRGQRVPYVIVNGPPGLPLIRLVRSPHDLINDPSLRPNALYYITKVIIPPINRCFLLIGADLNTWFNEMPRRRVQYLPTSSPTKAKKSTISQYFATTSCACCTKQTRDGLCARCVDDPQSTAVVLHEKVREWERSRNETYKICQSCCGRMSELPCVSLDCPVLYRLVQTERDAQQADFVRDLIERHLDF